ncbi:flagellar biosynthesis protein FlhA [Inquilinus limosus]|uniref:flagellar biosynthesis protein FlhA n=1 Tax=Inquilinus limosus TaxID=171674 RepID=UPI003F175704
MSSSSRTARPRVAGVNGNSALARLSLAGAFGVRHRDILFAMGIAAILSVLLLPLPVVVLDISLAFSFAISVLILMVALWIGRASDFSSFPTVLLVVTLMRLALNVATTRLILSHGHEGPGAAGHVIQGFSGFIMSGNFVIGVILFAILVVVNYIVITKGSTRIAEVGARFTLDAIPGKQMAIDADLSAGMIDEKEARRRRQELEDESSFYGAMDGASKFVRGDAVAGLIIVFINLVGGIVIGTLQRGMPIGEAITTFATLTVGDGLVSQIPALLVSLAAGLVISKGSNRGPTEQVVLSQLGAYPKALLVAAGLLLLLAVAPGLPAFPFLVLVAIFGGLAWIMPRVMARRAEEARRAEAAAADPPKTAEQTVQTLLRVDELRLEIGVALVSMVGMSDDLAEKLKTLRGRFAGEYGFVLPSIRIKDSADLGNTAYRLLVHGEEVARGEVRLASRLVLAPGGSVALPGVPTKDPTFGLPALWVDAGLAEEAEALGCTVVSPEGVIVTHVAEAVKDNFSALLTYAAAERLIDGIDPEYARLVKELVPTQLPMMTIVRVLQSLLAERVSIRNLPAILEAIAEAVAWTRSAPMLVEHVRMRLAGQICRSLTDADGYLSVITMSADRERELAQAVMVEGEERRFALAPDRVQGFLAELRGKIQAHAGRDPLPAVLVNPDARPFVRSLLERISPATAVISHNEIARRTMLRTVDVV